MSFQRPYSIVNNRFQDYLLTLFLVVGAYVVGNIPILVVFSLFNSESSDIIQVVQQETGNTIAFALLLLPWVFVFFALLICAKHILKWSFPTLFTNRKKIDFKRFFFAFGMWFLVSFGLFFSTKNDLVLTNFQPEKFFPLLFVAIVVLFIQCTAEEILFRSFLLKWLGTKISNGFILSVITGIIFGYLHGSNPEVEAVGKIALLYYIGTGIFLGLLTVIDDGLELSAGFHFANNLFAALIVTSNWQVFQTDAVFMDTNPPSFNALDFSLAFGGQIVFFLICWKVYGWKLLRGK